MENAVSVADKQRVMVLMVVYSFLPSLVFRTIPSTCRAGNRVDAASSLMLARLRPIPRMEDRSITGWWTPTARSVRTLREGGTVATDTE